MFELKEITKIEIDWEKVEDKFEKLLLDEVEKLTYVSVEISADESLVFCDLVYKLNREIGKETLVIVVEDKTDLIEKVEYIYSKIKKWLNS